MTAYRPSFINALRQAGAYPARPTPYASETDAPARRTVSPRNYWLVLAAVVVLGGMMFTARSYAAAGTNLVNGNGSCLQVDEDNGLSLRECQPGAEMQTWEASDNQSLRAAGKCLDIATMKGPALPVAYMAACDGTRSQQWKIDEAAKHVISGRDDMCLHNVFAAKGENSRIVVAACQDIAQQQWILQDSGQTEQATSADTFGPESDAPATRQPAADKPATPESTAITPPVAGGGSGTAVPIGDIDGWKQVFYDDFTKAAILGSWGSECDGDKIVYTGAQGQQWKSYPSCYKDTYQKRPYRADQVLSVKDGFLNFHLHNVDGQPAGANPSPVLNTGSQYQTYGRYVARFKVDTPTLEEYHIAWLLWPESGIWPEGGEEDFPEGSLAEPVGGYHHYANGGACRGCQDAAKSDFKYTDWHTYTLEWLPGRVRYIVDDKVILDSTKWVPDKPMRWQLQTETNGDGDASGNLTVDWVAVYSYQK